MTRRPSSLADSLPDLPAFTLVELLVVVACISGLLALLLPALQAARRQMHTIVCQNHLRRIAFGWEVYLANHQQQFFQGVNANRDYGGWKGTGGGALDRPLNPCLGLPMRLETDREAQIFHCPADAGGDYGSIAYRHHGNSYQANLILIGPTQLPTAAFLPQPIVTLHRKINSRLINLKASTLSYPAQLLLAGDYNWAAQWDPLAQPDYGGRSWHGRPKYYSMAFLDCHVEFLKIRKGIYIDPNGGYRIQPFRQFDEITLKMQDRIVREVCSPQ